MNMANNVSQTQASLGNARGASAIASGRAWGNALTGAGNTLAGSNWSSTPDTYGSYTSRANSNGFGNAFTNMSDPAYG
jgi:hypothetical protein